MRVGTGTQNPLGHRLPLRCLPSSRGPSLAKRQNSFCGRVGRPHFFGARRSQNRSPHQITRPILLGFVTGLRGTQVVGNHLKYEDFRGVQKGVQIFFGIDHFGFPDQPVILKDRLDGDWYGGQIQYRCDWVAEWIASRFIPHVLNWPRTGPNALPLRSIPLVYACLKVMMAPPILQGEVWQTPGYLMGLRLQMVKPIYEMETRFILEATSMQLLEREEQARELESLLHERRHLPIGSTEPAVLPPFAKTIVEVHARSGSQLRILTFPTDQEDADLESI